MGVGKKHKNRIGIDIDAVVADTNTSIIDVVNKQFGLSLTINDMDIASFVENYEGIPSEHRVSFAKSLFNNNHFYENLTMVEGADKVINALAAEGYRIFYITTRPRSSSKTTLKWLTHNDLYPPDTRILHPRDYEDDLEFKQKKVDMLELDIFLEDRLEVVNKIYIPVILFDYPYNRGITSANVTRVHSWVEAERVIRNLYR